MDKVKNWKTSLFGGLAVACGTASQIPVPPEYEPYRWMALAGASVFGSLFAYYSKDKDVTGADK